MQATSRIGSLCTATISPFGPCVGIAYGRIITGSNFTLLNGVPVATEGSQIAYNGLVYPYSGGSPIWVSWIGRVLTSNSNTFVGWRSLAVIGTPTDSNGFVIEGISTVYA